MAKKIFKYLGIFMLAVVLLAAGLIGWLSLTEYRPEALQPAEHIIGGEGAAAPVELTLCSWNIGYCGLGAESDFFMDGGEMVNPPYAAAVEKNMAGIQAYMAENPADVWLLQEVDVDSRRTDNFDQLGAFAEGLGANAALAYNYKCGFVPFPLPPIGRVNSGIAILTELQLSGEARRIGLHCPYSWPVRVANLKRCLLVDRIPVEGSDKELVIIDLHLEAYESGEGRIIQTRQLMELMEEEYSRGNYVIAGGDFNQSFPGTTDIYPIREGVWTPGQMENTLPEGWSYAFDPGCGTCRLLDAPLSADSQLYVIDGFILSPNLELREVKTVDMGFEYSDHNPVRISVKLN